MKFSNKPMIIYFITKEDEVVYIGQTKQTLHRRKIDHISQGMNGRGAVMGAAIRKHGADKFEWNKHSVYYNQIDLDAAERHYIDKYRPRYNVQPGGQPPVGWSNFKGKRFSEESLANIRASAKVRRRSSRPNDTQEAKDARAEGRRQAYLKTKKKIICHQNGKTYGLVVDAAKDLDISANGIYAALNPHHCMQCYKGYTFSYLE